MIRKNQNHATTSIDTDELISTDPLIGIRDIAYLLYRSRKFTVVITISFLVIGVIYSFFFTQPLYRATAVVIPPSNTQASLLNGITNNSYSGDELFQTFRMDIMSKKRQVAFFKEPETRKLIEAGSSPTDNFVDATNLFREGFVIDFDKHNRMTIHIHWTDPDIAEQLTNLYIEFVERASSQKVISEFLNNIEAQREILREKIRRHREDGVRNRLDQIARLEEAKKIAVQLGLFDFNSATVAIPLYFRGVKALEAEIQVLRNRTNDDPHSPNIASDIGRLYELEQIEGDASWLNYVVTAEVEIDAHADQDFVKPVRYLIWLSGLALGLLCSIIFVVLLHYIRASRHRAAND